MTHYALVPTPSGAFVIDPSRTVEVTGLEERWLMVYNDYMVPVSADAVEHNGMLWVSETVYRSIFPQQPMVKCDLCNREIPRSEEILYCTPRPSDPAEVCSAIGGCVDCFPGPHGGLCGTRAEVEAYFEANKDARGWLRLSI